MAPKRRSTAAASNLTAIFDQSKIQEMKEAFTVIDQNRDGVITKEDLMDTYAAMGCLNVPKEELDAMIKEASGPINSTTFLTMFGEKLKGSDPEDSITAAFRVLDPEGNGAIKKEYLEDLLLTQCNRFTEEEVKNMWSSFPPDLAGNIDYKSISYIITHGRIRESEGYLEVDS